MNKVVLVCHCLLDPLTRVRGAKKIDRALIRELIEKDISILQLPCPEMMYGFSRPPRSKEEYDTPEYRGYCRDLAEDIADMVQVYSEFTICGLISIGGSPTCGFQRTHVKGETAEEPGILMEEIQKVFKERNITLTICDHELLEDVSRREAFLNPV
jgi:predicted secreted protein